MPIFEYKCLSCRKSFSVIKLSRSDDAAKCPYCGATEVRKQISTFSCGGAADALSGGGGFTGGT